MPRPPLRTKQVMDAMTAYQVVHMLEGVVTRGTAQRLRDLNRPLFGKTGTTSGPNDVWFIGGTPDIVAGVRSEEHTSELQSLMRISYAVFCLKKKKPTKTRTTSKK